MYIVYRGIALNCSRNRNYRARTCSSLSLAHDTLCMAARDSQYRIIRLCSQFAWAVEQQSGFHYGTFGDSRRGLSRLHASYKSSSADNDGATSQIIGRFRQGDPFPYVRCDDPCGGSCRHTIDRFGSWA